MAGLKQQVATGGGPAQTLLADAALSGQLRQLPATSSTQRLDQSMEALQHNFLLCGYFRRQERKKSQAAGQWRHRISASPRFYL